MNFFGGLLGIVIGALMVKYREQVGNMIGDPEWAAKVGGIYNVIIILGILMCLWGLAAMTNTQDLLFAPILMFLPHPAK